MLKNKERTVYRDLAEEFRVLFNSRMADIRKYLFEQNAGGYLDRALEFWSGWVSHIAIVCPFEDVPVVSPVFIEFDDEKSTPNKGWIITHLDAFEFVEEYAKERMDELLDSEDSDKLDKEELRIDLNNSMVAAFKSAKERDEDSYFYAISDWIDSLEYDPNCDYQVLPLKTKHFYWHYYSTDPDDIIDFEIERNMVVLILRLDTSRIFESL